MGEAAIVHAEWGAVGEPVLERNRINLLPDWFVEKQRTVEMEYTSFAKLATATPDGSFLFSIT